MGSRPTELHELVGRPPLRMEGHRGRDVGHHQCHRLHGRRSGPVFHGPKSAPGGRKQHKTSSSFALRGVVIPSATLAPVKEDAKAPDTAHAIKEAKADSSTQHENHDVFFDDEDAPEPADTKLSEHLGKVNRCESIATSYTCRAASYKLQAASCKPQATGFFDF